jgi:hypothetical protein
MSSRKNGKSNGRVGALSVSRIATSFISQSYFIPITITTPFDVSGYSLEIRWVRRSDGELTPWREVSSVHGSQIFHAGHLWMLEEREVYALQKQYGYRQVQYRARTLRDAALNDSGVAEVGAWVEADWTDLPGVMTKTLIWPRSEVAIAAIVDEVRSLMSDRLGMVVSTDEIMAEIDRAIADAWPTYGELWRYELPLDEFSKGKWVLPLEVDQAVPYAVRFPRGDSWELLNRSYSYDQRRHELVVPEGSSVTVGNVQLEMMLPPEQIDTTASDPQTRVNRRYVVLATAKNALSMFGERTGVDVFEKQRELDMQLQMEMLRSGGGPSRDSQGVAHG